MTLFPITLLLLAAAGPAGEDAAHRADRLRTEALNRAAAAVVADRTRSDDAREQIYRSKRDRYERDMAAWREREAARQSYNAGLR